MRAFGVAHDFRGLQRRRRADGVPGRPERYGPRRMAVRDGRGAGLRRAALGRPGLVALVVALYLAAGLVATCAGALALGHALPRARRRPATARRRRATTCRPSYHLWLVGHQLAHGARAVASTRTPSGRRAAPRSNFGGWPFGLAYWPLDALLRRTCGGWNLFAAALLPRGGRASPSSGCARSRSGRGGGARRRARLRARAVPRRRRARGHLLGPISVLLPLALWASSAAGAARRWWSSARARRSPRSRSPGRCTSRSARSLLPAYALCRGAPGSSRRSRPCRALGAALLVSALLDRAARSARGGRSLARGGVATPRPGSTSSRATRGTGSRASSSSAG